MNALIETEADIRRGLDVLVEKEPRFAIALEATGLPPLRRRPDGFAQLLSAIVSQQVSTASADAIWKRVEAAGFCDPEAIMRASDEDLRACGLSRPKLRYARALAEAKIDFDALRPASSDEVIGTLTAVSGIGPWTAQIYAMFSLGHPDVFAPADLALQEAARILFELPDRPKPKAFEAMADAWSPWRAVAARLLWAYYRVAKKREGIR